MLAVTTSDIQPLPHQLRAVYGELLPRTPLRFLLADDPGAGKTIMAGLYIKELILREDVKRCLIVVPGGLVDQWQDELYLKFGLAFEILTPQFGETVFGASAFEQHPLLIARMDQLARNEILLAQLAKSEWDLVVVDEAHRMGAHYFAGKLEKTKRFQLGEQLGDIARHLLLMTATPHSGKEEDFQLFLTLLDRDRFEGKYQAKVHSADTSGVMRRMVKEDLLTFDGKPLFPERIAETVPYELTELEQDLYEQVTTYVREGMNRAAKLDGKRRNTVGFALTVLQRRLASSPEAIYRSLERRAARLERRKQEVLAGGDGRGAQGRGRHRRPSTSSTTTSSPPRRWRSSRRSSSTPRPRRARSRSSTPSCSTSPISSRRPRACGRQTPTASGQSCARSSRTTRSRPPARATSGAS